MSPVDEEVELYSKQRSSGHLRSSSEEDFTKNLSGMDYEETCAEDLTREKTDSTEEDTTTALELPISSRVSSLRRKFGNLEIPKRSELYERLDSEKQDFGPCLNSLQAESPGGGDETAEETLSSGQVYMASKQNLGDDQPEESEAEIIPEESILKRINSHIGTNSYQLGKQLSCKWSMGAGPRIGCVRDYPSKLHFQALELVNLSPKSDALSRSYLFQLVRGLSSPPRSSGRENAPTTLKTDHHS